MILQRYILRELLISFGLTLAVVLGVMAVGASFQMARDYSGAGLEFFVQVGPTLLAYVGPYAIMVALATGATLAYGRMAADNEIDAMRTSGVPALRVLIPACVLGIFMGFASYGINEHLAPRAHQNRKEILRRSVLTLLRSPAPGRQNIQIGSNMVSWQDVRNGTLIMPVVIRMAAGFGIEERYSAATGQIRMEEGKAPVFELTKVRIEIFHPERPQTLTAESVPYTLDVSGIYDGDKGIKGMSRAELIEHANDPATHSRRIPKALTESHDRYAKAFAAPLLVLLGACVGIITRKGNRLAGLGSALPAVVGYMVIWGLMRGMGEKGRIAPMAAAYIPDLAVGILILVLLWRIMRR